MRMSQLFSQTLREAPGDTDVPSHQLLLRAGFIRPLAAGIFSYLPLAKRSMLKIESIIREEMDAIGGQEITMPVIHPADIWQESGRWYKIGSEMGRFKDRADRDMVLAMTHEEIVSDLVRKEIRSYRQLPALVYQIQTKWRDEPRPRAGLIRVREFTMKDSYSLDADWEGLDKQYRAHYSAYFRIYTRCGLPVIAVKSDTGMMGGKEAHEFMYLTSIGEDTLMVNEESGYAANREVATIKKPVPANEAALPLEKIATPNTTTIESLANFLNIPASRTAKAVFQIATLSEGDQQREQFVLAIVRGDMEVNEVKLANAVQAIALRPALPEEIAVTGAVAGYGSPIGVKNALVVVDDLIPQSPNLAAGANEAGYHYTNVNYGRDYTASVVADIVAAREGDLDPIKGKPLNAVRGVEVGNIFKLGTRYSDSLNCTYLDKDGKAQPVVMGSYGIGVGRLLACIAEEHNDDKGLKWPISIAPYAVHLLMLPDTFTTEPAERLYTDLRNAGVEVLFDDRDARLGVKFNDADLIGLPLRLTLTKKSLENGGAELKRRDRDEASIVPLDKAVDRVQQVIVDLWSELNQTVRSNVTL
ncbi:MAG: proline--tRNA ligase [Chloroflexi bacterium]|nr:proline--tRNA ligase [Chloroflexota bacterium]MCC6896735.1 proline--tRNA ligase [Anaerolineae bacterium]